MDESGNIECAQLRTRNVAVDMTVATYTNKIRGELLSTYGVDALLKVLRIINSDEYVINKISNTGDYKYIFYEQVNKDTITYNNWLLNNSAEDFYDQVINSLGDDSIINICSIEYGDSTMEDLHNTNGFLGFIFMDNDGNVVHTPHVFEDSDGFVVVNKILVE